MKKVSRETERVWVREFEKREKTCKGRLVRIATQDE